eukprot:3178379-Pyramimonas_sp.AAC.1
MASPTTYRDYQHALPRMHFVGGNSGILHQGIRVQKRQCMGQLSASSRWKRIEPSERGDNRI